MCYIISFRLKLKPLRKIVHNACKGVAALAGMSADISCIWVKILTIPCPYCSMTSANLLSHLEMHRKLWCCGPRIRYDVYHILEWSWDSVQAWHLADSHNDCHEGRIVIHKSWLGWTRWPQNCCALWMNTFYNLGRNWTPCLVWGSSMVCSDVNCVSCRLFYKCRMFLLRSMLCSTTQQSNQVFGKLLWQGLSTYLSFGFLISVYALGTKPFYVVLVALGLLLPWLKCMSSHLPWLWDSFSHHF